MRIWILKARNKIERNAWAGKNDDRNQFCCIHHCCSDVVIGVCGRAWSISKMLGLSDTATINIAWYDMSSVDWHIEDIEICGD